MAKKNKVLAFSNLPIRPPIWSTVTCILALDYWNAPEWVYGTLGVTFLIGWIAYFITVTNETKVDLLKNDDDKKA